MQQDPAADLHSAGEQAASAAKILSKVHKDSLDKAIEDTEKERRRGDFYAGQVGITRTLLSVTATKARVDLQAAKKEAAEEQIMAMQREYVNANGHEIFRPKIDDQYCEAVKFGGPGSEDRLQSTEFHSAAEICKTETEQRLRSAYDSGRKSC